MQKTHLSLFLAFLVWSDLGWARGVSADQTALSAALAKSQINWRNYDYDKRMAAVKSIKNYPIVRGMAFPVEQRNLKHVVTLLGHPLKEIKDFEACGDGTGDILFEYKEATFGIRLQDKKVIVDHFSFKTPGNAYRFKNHVFDKNTRERDFILKTKNWIEGDIDEHYYRLGLHGDWASEYFYFKNGTLDSYSFGASC